MSTRVIRVTMFKIPSKEAQQKYLENYRALSATAVKDSKPYILSLHAGPTADQDDARGQGFTVVAKSEFKDLADLEYYDKECEAHKAFKVKAKEIGHQGIMTVWYTPEVVIGNGM